MHYIRILRPPTVTASKPGGTTQLGLLLTVTTDLGEFFLSPDDPVELQVILYPAPPPQDPPSTGGGSGDEVGVNDGDGGSSSDVQSSSTTSKQLPGISLSATKGREALTWRAGTRLLKVEALCPPSLSSRDVKRSKVCIRPKDTELSAGDAYRVQQGDETRGLIMPLFVELREESPEDTLALRRMRISEEHSARTAWVEVEEELGESIARHVWDAGVCTTAMLADVCSVVPWICERFSSLAGILSIYDLNVLEIGCGVGMLGVGLATALELSSIRGDDCRASIVMTDLPDAQARASANISRFEASRKTQGLRETAKLDYENLDWEDGRKGVFGPKIGGRPWNLIMLSDCTYNDMLPALAETLSEIHSLSLKRAGAAPDDLRAGPKVLVSTKCRHPAEREFFGLMNSRGWKIIESYVSKLPHLGEKPETLEVYLWARYGI